MKTLTVVIMWLVMFGLGVQVGITHGRAIERTTLGADESEARKQEEAYNKGWSDAQCGVGQSCESGDN